jgi:hypothetical protein
MVSRRCHSVLPLKSIKLVVRSGRWTVTAIHARLAMVNRIVYSKWQIESDILVMLISTHSLAVVDICSRVVLSDSPARR